MRLPLVELIEQARLRVNSVLDPVSQQTIEMILRLSTEQVAGPRTPGQARGEILRGYGRQNTRVSLEDRQSSVERPRWRRKGQGRGGEVEIAANPALQSNPAMCERRFTRHSPWQRQGGQLTPRGGKKKALVIILL
jgi:hypothetical protein